MGKGGTKFVGDAVGVRFKSKGYTTKDAQRDMAHFQEHGVHPELERARLAQANAIPPLPERSTLRQHVFLQLAINNQPLGKLVIELFDDIAPVAVAHFRNRCSEGASDGFKGTLIHRIVPRMGVFGGKSARYKEGVHMKRYMELRHSDRALASVSLAGDEFCITFGRALTLDDTHQVVGRLCHDFEALLERLEGMSTDPDDVPYQRVRVARCGFTDAAGSLEDFDDSGAGSSKKESAEEGAARVQLEAAKARQSVKDALQAGLTSQKRKAGAEGGEPGGGSSGGAAGGGGGRPAKRGMLDSLLGAGLSDGSGSSSGSESEADK